MADLAALKYEACLVIALDDRPLAGKQILSLLFIQLKSTVFVQRQYFR